MGILQLDLSQIEWRSAAWLSQDKTMIEEINSGVDQHAASCTDPELMDMPLTKENRFGAKIFNFRMIYRGSAYGYYMDDTMPSFSQRKWGKVVAGFWEKYWELDVWHQKIIRFVWKNGYLKSPTGRVYVFKKDKEESGIMVYNERKIANYPVQGISGDIISLLIVILRRGLRAYGLKSKMILTVHDSVVFDYLEKELDMLIKLCKAVMSDFVKSIENYYKVTWNVNLEADIETGENYGQLKGV